MSIKKGPRRPLPFFKKLRFNIFSGDMRVGKNPFCFAECAAPRAAHGAKQQGNYL